MTIPRIQENPRGRRWNCTFFPGRQAARSVFSHRSRRGVEKAGKAQHSCGF